MSWFFKNNGANNFNISTSINVYGKNTDNTELEKDVRREREKDAPTELEKDGDEVGLEKGEGDEGLLKRKRDEEKEKPEREESKKSEKVKESNQSISYSFPYVRTAEHVGRRRRTRR